jgi:hypothetical protein
MFDVSIEMPQLIIWPERSTSIYPAMGLVGPKNLFHQISEHISSRYYMPKLREIGQIGQIGPMIWPKSKNRWRAKFWGVSDSSPYLKIISRRKSRESMRKQ